MRFCGKIFFVVMRVKKKTKNKMGCLFQILTIFSTTMAPSFGELFKKKNNHSLAIAINYAKAFQNSYILKAFAEHTEFCPKQMATHSLISELLFSKKLNKRQGALKARIEFFVNTI